MNKADEAALAVVRQHGTSYLSNRTDIDRNTVHTGTAMTLIRAGLLQWAGHSVRKIGGRTKNVAMVGLTAATETDPWKIEFVKRMVDVVIADGESLPDNPLIPKWEHNSLGVRAEVKEHGINYRACTWTEDVSYETGGCCCSSNSYTYVIDVQVALGNGAVRKFRYNGTVSDIILRLLNPDR